MWQPGQILCQKGQVRVAGSFRICAVYCGYDCLVWFGCGLSLLVVSHVADGKDYWVVYDGYTAIKAVGTLQSPAFTKINLSNCRNELMTFIHIYLGKSYFGTQFNKIPLGKGK